MVYMGMWVNTKSFSKLVVRIQTKASTQKRGKLLDFALRPVHHLEQVSVVLRELFNSNIALCRN